METGVLLSHFAQQLRRKIADVLEIYFTLLDAAVVSPTVGLNENERERGSWVPFKMLTSEAANNVHAGWCCLWGCAQFNEN